MTHSMPEAGQGSGRAVCYSCTRRSLVPHSFAAGPCTASMKVRSAVRPPGHVPSQWKNTPATDRGVRRSKHSILHVQGRGCCPSAPVARGVHECYEKVVGAMCKTSAENDAIFTSQQMRRGPSQQMRIRPISHISHASILALTLGSPRFDCLVLLLSPLRWRQMVVHVSTLR